MIVSNQQGLDEQRRAEEEEAQPVRHHYLSPICGCLHRGSRPNFLTGEDAKYLYTCAECWDYAQRAFADEQRQRAEEHARKSPHYADHYIKRDKEYPEWLRDNGNDYNKRY